MNQPTSQTIILNLGNQNVKLDHESPLKHPELRERFGNDFRGMTFHLLEHYEDYADRLELAIMDKVITEHFDCLICICTCQHEKSEHRKKDTIYEADLIRRLVEDRHPGLVLEKEEYTGNPTQEAEIFPQLSNWLKVRLFKNPEECFTYVNAGGTPQMKLALKQLLEYYLPEDPGRLKTAAVPEGERSAREYDERYNRAYRTLDVARQLVLERFDYRGAINVLREIPGELMNLQETNLLKLLTIGAMRVEAYPPEEILQRIGIRQVRGLDLGQPAREETDLHSFFKEQTPDYAIGQRLKKQRRFEVYEQAILADLYFNCFAEDEHVDTAVLTFQSLVEQTGQSLAECVTKLDLSKQEGKDQLKTYASRPNEENIPLYLGVAKRKAEDAEMRAFIDKLRNTQSYFKNNKKKGINKLRNNARLTHGRSAIAREQLNEMVPGFLGSDGEPGLLDEILAELGVGEVNPYRQLNRAIEREFLQQL